MATIIRFRMFRTYQRAARLHWRLERSFLRAPWAQNAEVRRPFLPHF